MSAKSFATADDLLSPPEIVAEVPAPELGSGKIVRVLIPNVQQYEELSAANYPAGHDPKAGPVPGQYIRTAIACVVDANNQRILTPDMAERLSRNTGTLLQRVFLASIRGVEVNEPAVEAEVGNS